MSLTREVVQERLNKLLAENSRDGQFIANKLVILCQKIFKEGYQVDQSEIDVMQKLLDTTQADATENFDYILAQALIAEYQRDEERVLASYHKLEKNFPEQWYVFAYHAKWLSDNNRHLEAIELLIQTKKTLSHLQHEAKDFYIMQSHLKKLDAIVMGVAPAAIERSDLTVSKMLAKAFQLASLAQVELAIHYTIRARNLISSEYSQQSGIKSTDFFEKILTQFKGQLSFYHRNELGSDWISLFGTSSYKTAVSSSGQQSTLGLRK
jgi:hypothetical protein